MRLYYSPGSCALGIHVILEELGEPFDLRRLNFAEREQYGETYLAINPKSKVPTLERDDGSVLTEFQAISTYFALTHPEKWLIPTDIERQTRMIEAMDYVVGTIHGQGFPPSQHHSAYVGRTLHHESSQCGPAICGQYSSWDKLRSSSSSRRR
jgi:glutathione S-transferase